ncbi:unnamed protein product, partial [Polarella glacialis]
MDRPLDWNMGGCIYSHGSTYPSPYLGLSRAGWALVQVDQQDQYGAAEKRAYGPVWSPFPQTAISAEWCAEAVAMQLTKCTDSRLVLDCSSVLRFLGQDV